MSKKKFPEVSEKLSPDAIQGGVLTEVNIDLTTEGLKSDNVVLPILPLRNMVVFPQIPVPITVEREISLNAIKHAKKEELPLFLICQKDANVENPGARDLYKVGVVANIVRVIEMENAPTTLFVFPVERAKLSKVTAKKEYLSGVVSRMPEELPETTDLTMPVIAEEVYNSCNRLVEILKETDEIDISFNYNQFKEHPLLRMNFISMNLPSNAAVRQKLLEETNIKKRMLGLLADIEICIKQTNVRREIRQQASYEMNQQQREMFLQQQLRSIQNELGNSADNDEEILREKGKEKKWSKETKKYFEKELAKLARLNPQSPDYSVQYTYLENFLKLPWNNYSNDNFSLDNIKEVLDADHFGLDKVKERIVEHTAVIKLRGDMKGSILCLYGPPGVGKTSLGKSVAKALGREYARVSLGGLHDEAEIRGHRRTYIGAMPGRILAALEKCGTGNPVFVLDEIDKIGADYKGDPSQALLEVLDPEQNSKFHDNFIDYDYDLSKIFFIATANDISKLSKPLLDRMELIEITGYTVHEKYEIGKRHLWKKVLEENGLGGENIVMGEEAMIYVIENYTRESGVRMLEKQLAKITRKLAYLKASGKPVPDEVTIDIVKEYLGKERNYRELYEGNEYAGVVTGLAWTSVGGEVLFIESSLSKGKGEKLTLTGSLGDVMKESAAIALQWLKANGERFGITGEMISTHDVHIHVPEGAVPKDGPSAGITMLTSLASAFTQKKVRANLAMTGEITLRGKVLPVGGIKEKMLAAKRAGITDVMLSSRNRKDIEEIESHYLEGLTFHFVDSADEVLDFALLDELAER